MSNELSDKAIEHLTDARRHFAQQQEAKPVAWTLRWPDDIIMGTVNYPTTYETKERAREYADGCTDGESIVVAPLYLHPPKPAAQPQVLGELIKFIEAKEHHLPIEDRHVLSAILNARWIPK